MSNLAKRVYLSLGSNLGDRVQNIRRALEKLSEVGIQSERVSSFYKTEPVDFRPQPWFVNCVVEARTELMPLQLLKASQGVERALGRRSGIPKGPRLIDIDILLYENAVVHSAALTIPHPRMSERRFVLLPLRELAPQLRHPLTQRTVLEMLGETQDSSRAIRMKDEG
jgi:2-amino-4-hydroxy-6-hydroxymethyldihydropteridine diphosphokinase